MIVVENLSKLYNRVTAVDDVSFEVQEGEILGFLGPNGAGKTTTMRIITGYTPPTSGEARVDGFSVKESPLEVRQRIGYLPENTPLYRDMDVASYLGFASQIKNVPSSQRGEQIRLAMDETGIADVARRTIGKLSKGYRQRVGLAQALLGNPKVLILDEPTVGLDPNQIREIRELIRNMSGKRTVILSTHILPEVSMICDRVLIINKGRIAAADAVGELSKRMAKTLNLRVQAKAPADDVNGALSDIEGVRRVETLELGGGDGLCQITLETDAEKDLRPIIADRISGRGWPLYELRSLEPTLEDIFVEIVAGGEGEA